MIRQYEVEDIIDNALYELNGKLSKPDYDTNKCTMYEADTNKTQSGEILFSFKEDMLDNGEEPQRFRIRIEFADQEMRQEDIKQYQMEHSLYYPTAPSLNTECPVRYDWLKCSSNSCGMCCRTCANYNPLRMLYQKELTPGIMFGVPLQVLLADAKIQLEY